MLIRLMYEFFKIGLFSIGGGLASLPFIYELSEKTGWFTLYDISNLVAVSEATPGPLGVNMATYVGYVSSGVPGGILAPIGLVTPSIIIIVIVAKFYNRFKESALVKDIFYCLRPVSTALILVAGISVFQLALMKAGVAFTLENLTTGINWKAAVLMVVLALLHRQIKKHPIIAVLSSGVVGIILQFAV
ncbi:MAG: chromate transporter [Lachnospiraceae bacterium]|nr:chromate transporter [Lachnospiraceae bacterium]